MSCSSRTSSTRTTRSGDQLRQVISDIHRGRPCDPCLLCKQGNVLKYVHPKSWKNEHLLSRLRQYEPSLDVQPDSCICRLCRDDISKIDDDNFMPRWRKNNQKNKCFLPDCTNISSKTTQLVDYSRLCNLFNISEENSEYSNMKQFPLCSEHYGTLYKQLNPTNRNCRTCSKVITDTSKTRKCPNPSLIQHFLSDNQDFVGTIDEEDRICNTCYKSHLVTIKHVTNSVESKDSDLEALVFQIRSTLPEVQKLGTADEVVSYISSEIAIYVGEMLLAQDALLLPDVYEMFQNKVDKVTSVCNIPVSTSQITTNMLRNNLSVILEPHMAYRCYAKKYGTVIYRHGGDLLFTLTKILSKSRRQNPEKSFQQKLSSVCNNLNSKIHHNIENLIKNDALQPHKIEEINIDECIAKFNPDVWTALNLLTKPRTASSNNTRQVRRFFCMCVLLFTTNSQCSYPLHTLLTDAIETCHGSGRLVKLLNRLGACASADTHARYVQYRVELSKQKGVMDDYSSEAFSVVSVDNLDFIHSFARIYSGKLQLSWHGTTIQIVLPNPSNSSQCTGDTLHGKRTLSSRSPSNQQSEDTHSPIRKKKRRSRTSTEHANSCILPELAVTTDPCTSLTIPNNETPLISQYVITIEDFQLSADENRAKDDLIKTSLYYILTKSFSEKTVIDFPSYFGLLHNIPVPECSQVIYYGVLNQKCDNKETILSIINQMYTEFIATKKKQWIVIEGDQVTYRLITSTKLEYGNDLSWLIPFPGDWHVLKNFQEVLQKVYFDGGLLDLAKSCGYQPNSIGTNFKRTHHFIVETWESLFRYFLSSFMSGSDQSSFDPQLITMWLESIPESPDQQSASRNLKEFLNDVSEKFPNFSESFVSFMDKNADKNKTWKLWKQYVFEDGLAYVCMHLAIRTGDWNLRIAALKSMAALFTAFDRPNYQKLISDHIVDIATMPPCVLAQLKNGGWTVSLTGRTCHSIGIDECHEMCINKDSKEYVTRPSADNLDRKAIFMPIRAKAIKELESQVSPEKVIIGTDILKSIFSNSVSDKKLELNIKCQLTKLGSSSLNSESVNNNLCHLFNSKKLTPEQESDLNHFREKGQNEFENRIKCYILKVPSVKPPKKRARLLTFTERKSNKRKVSDIDKERKLQIECWKKRVAYSAATGQTINKMFEQCIDLPRAISTSEGELNKGTKATTSTFYEKRYEATTPCVFLTRFPDDWAPLVVIMEGMFLINIAPWDAHKTIGSYADFLLKQHVMPHYRNGATEVHVLFDNPKGHSLKQFERSKRDRLHPIPDSHYCMEFSADLLIPPKWNQEVLNCRKCKRNLVCFLSNYFLKKMKQHLQSHQKFITAGGFSEVDGVKAMGVTSRGMPHEEPQLFSDAEESDTRIWIHALNASDTTILILSPDTDVYHIGIPLVAHTNLDIIVQLSKFNNRELRLVNMKALIHAFNNDPSLAPIPSSFIPQTLQVLYVSTGCDFTSYFHGLGKTSFLNAFFEYAGFICSSGLLANTDEETSFFSFVRLVGTTYFRKHKSVFLPSYPTPMTLFNSFSKDSLTPLEQHSMWLEAIRERVWSKISYEEEMVPSIGALQRHWKRSRYVVGIWKQAASNITTYPPFELHGWKLKDNVLAIDWDSEEHMSQVRSRVALIKKGCGCKTGCSSNRCKCRKNNVQCGPGCTCDNCCNHPVSQQVSIAEDMPDSESESESESGEYDELNDDVDDIMRSIFGECDSPLTI